MLSRNFQIPDCFEVRFVAEASGCERVHTHDYPVFVGVLSGGLFLKLNEATHCLQPGALTRIGSHQPHAVTEFSSDFGGVYTLSVFQGAEWGDLREGMDPRDASLYFMDLCERLLSSQSVAVKCEAVEAWLNDSLVAVECEKAIDCTGHLRLAERIKARLDAETLESPPFAEIARACGCTQIHCNRIFRAHYGVSMQSYYLNRKAEYARSLIPAGRPLGAIALEAGFYDQSHMTRVFKGVFQTTPDSYRRNISD